MTVEIAGLPRPALVASDLDGTLLRNNGTVSTRTVAAVRAVQDAGIHWVIVTARPPRWLHDLVDVVGDHGVALCSNGAFVYDVAQRVVREERTLALDVLHDLVDRLRSAIPSIAFAVEHRAGYGREPAYDEIHPAPPDAALAPIHDLLDPLPGKLMARAPGHDGADFLARVTAVVGDAAVVSYSGASGLAEISAAGVTKAAVLAAHCEGLQVAAEHVWAFGDMPNDVPMLTWAGTSFAVADGHPDARAAADRVCPSNDDDGVAYVLERILETASF
jgi:HAD superfamily hydrolase (TIGR01484 family)